MATISKTTAYNWKRLDSNPDEKLTKRANKTQSARHVVASSYVDNADAARLLATVNALQEPTERIMYSLAVAMLRAKQIADKPHVEKFLEAYRHTGYTEIDVPEQVWASGEDILGFVYQSLLTEGERNATGQYYTSRKIAHAMTGGRLLADGETLLDPCCGSGAFLLSVETANPQNLYGFDISPTAVMMASANLLAKYAGTAFTPNVYCVDFLKADWHALAAQNIPLRFDRICTNPPWGSDKAREYAAAYPVVRSKERASMFVVEAVSHLRDSGILHFLLPASLLKIRTHADIRRWLLTSTTIQQIDLYSNRFDGVYTNFFSIRLKPGHTAEQRYRIGNGETCSDILLPVTDNATDIPTERMNAIDESIIRKMEMLRHDNLSHSRWALGIVTGNNKDKVKTVAAPGMEPVFTGRQVMPFALAAPTSYIRFTPSTFQQCAKEELYRAPEKLIYRFIARYPVVAYDDRQCLCLNSANILIPQLDGISVKSAAALLNSSLYRHYYSVRFPDIKVLKGNLQALPFPKLTQSQDRMLATLVSAVKTAYAPAKYLQAIDDAVFTLFGITAAERSHIAANLPTL